MKMNTVLPLMAAVVLSLSACQSTQSGASSADSGTSGTKTQAAQSETGKGICREVRGDTGGAGRSVLYRCDGRAVLASEEARSVLGGGAQISFGSGGSVIKSNLVTRQAANRVGNTDEDTCIRAWINAAAKFQQTAAKLGGSRVTGFYSYYDRKPLHGGAYICEVGTFHGRVVMGGSVAR